MFNISMSYPVGLFLSSPIVEINYHINGQVEFRRLQDRLVCCGFTLSVISDDNQNIPNENEFVIFCDCSDSSISFAHATCGNYEMTDLSSRLLSHQCAHQIILLRLMKVGQLFYKFLPQPPNDQLRLFFDIPGFHIISIPIHISSGCRTISMMQ